MASASGELLPVSELKVCLQRALFVTRPSLFIAVVDRSGSMQGRPWQQVETALLHIMGLSSSNTLVRTVIVAYASDASVINTSGTQAEVNQRIRTMFTGGGTNFTAAFKRVCEVLTDHCYDDNPAAAHQDHNVSNVTVAFMTDGQANGGRQGEQLVSDFRELLDRHWVNPFGEAQNQPVNVHAIGFGAHCDRVLLEGLRTAGTAEGTFRYAEPTDDGDTLCHKLTSLFEVASKSSVVPVSMVFDRLRFRSGEHKRSIQFPVDEHSCGEHSC
jgi:hypothetical protein